jgi:hypothetical protein
MCRIFKRVCEKEPQTQHKIAYNNFQGRAIKAKQANPLLNFNTNLTRKTDRSQYLSKKSFLCYKLLKDDDLSNQPHMCRIFKRVCKKEPQTQHKIAYNNFQRRATKAKQANPLLISTNLT